MKIQFPSSFSFNRSLLALSLGCALASLPVAVRAQDAPSAAAPGAVMPTEPIPATTAPADMPAEKPAASTAKPAAATADAPANDKLSAKEQAMLKKFANGNEGEVEMAKLALASAESQDVKDFAQKMIDDHGKANDDLAALAKSHGMELKPMLPADEHAAYKKAKEAKGSSFDVMYVKHAVADHTMDVKEYHMAQKEVKNPELLAYVEKTTPIIEGHLTMAKEMEGKLMPASAKNSKKG